MKDLRCEARHVMNTHREPDVLPTQSFLSSVRPLAAGSRWVSATRLDLFQCHLPRAGSCPDRCNLALKNESNLNDGGPI